PVRFVGPTHQRPHQRYFSRRLQRPRYAQLWLESSESRVGDDAGRVAAGLPGRRDANPHRAVEARRSDALRVRIRVAGFHGRCRRVDRLGTGPQSPGHHTARRRPSLGPATFVADAARGRRNRSTVGPAWPGNAGAPDTDAYAQTTADGAV